MELLGKNARGETEAPEEEKSRDKQSKFNVLSQRTLLPKHRSLPGGKAPATPCTGLQNCTTMAKLWKEESEENLQCVFSDNIKENKK